MGFFTRTPNKGYVYYVKLQTDDGPLYKLGFTTKASVHERFSYKDYGDEKLIDCVFLFSASNRAYEAEQTLHRYFKKKRAYRWACWPHKPLYLRGQSELYREDILGMDDAIYVRQEEVRSIDPSSIKERKHPFSVSDHLGIAVLLFIIFNVFAILVWLGLIVIDWMKKEKPRYTISYRTVTFPRPTYSADIEKLIGYMKEVNTIVPEVEEYGHERPSDPLL